MLRLVYLVGWVPALVGAYVFTGRPAAPTVISADGPLGFAAGAALAATLTILTAGYLAALRRPPSQRVLLATVALSLAAALAMPALFSADVYAYAYYGDLLWHGRNPYGHGPPPVDAIARAAVAAWGGQTPPRCVYGPLAVAIAAATDLTGLLGGVPASILAARVAAALAYGVCIAIVLRLVRDPRLRALLILNPTVIWSVAEGHNDAAVLALIGTGLLVRPSRWVAFASAALIKIPALASWGRIERRREILFAWGLTVAGYVPLLVALAGAGPGSAAAGGAAAWQSPLGLLADRVGRLSAIGLAWAFLGACALGTRRLAPADRTAALALAGWFALPNAYPWYALWIVPIAARNVSSVWSRALLTAAAFAPARALLDAAYAAADRGPAAADFHSGMIGLEFIPPLVALGWAARQRRALVLPVLISAWVTLGSVPARAQSGPSPAPLPAPALSSAPQPAPAAPLATTTPLPAPTVAPATNAPSAAATSAGVPPPTTPAPLPPTPNPFAYIITPPPVASTSPDGPHILEVDLNDRRIRVGGPLIVRVITSANVVGVEARALGRFIAIPQNSPGTFALAYTLPDAIPFWLLNRNYDIVIAAATADGRQVTVTFPMLLMR